MPFTHDTGWSFDVVFRNADASAFDLSAATSVSLLFRSTEQSVRMHTASLDGEIAITNAPGADGRVTWTCPADASPFEDWEDGNVEVQGVIVTAAGTSHTVKGTAFSLERILDRI